MRSEQKIDEATPLFHPKKCSVDFAENLAVPHSHIFYKFPYFQLLSSSKYPKRIHIF